MTTFTEFKKKLEGSPTLGICPRCMKNPTAGAVGLQIKQRNSGREKGDKTLASMTKALCEPCAIQVYEELTGLYNDLLRQP